MISIQLFCRFMFIFNHICVCMCVWALYICMQVPTESRGTRSPEAGVTAAVSCSVLMVLGASARA